MAAGRLNPGERPPIAVVLPGSAGGRDWLAPPTVAIAADLPLEVHERAAPAQLAAPCVLMIEPARDQRVGHRLIGRDTVRSLYQNGVRSERNPEYDARPAAGSPGRARSSRTTAPSILKVGDPMLDLVGLLIGGLVSGFSKGIGERDLDEAMTELAATPRSRDRPLYRRLRVRADHDDRRQGGDHSGDLARPRATAGSGGPSCASASAARS